MPPGGSEKKRRGIFNSILWKSDYVDELPRLRKFGAAGVDVDSHIMTDSASLSLTFPLFQRHTDLVSGRLVLFGINEVRVGQKSTDTCKPKKELSDFSKEEHRKSLLKKHDKT